MIEVAIPGSLEFATAAKEAPIFAETRLVTALTKSAIYIQGQARKEAPVDTGVMRSLIRYRLDGLTATIFTDAKSAKGAPYPIYVHEGTGQNARDQSLTNGRIKHGGIKPNPFFDRAVAQSRLYMDDAFRLAADEVINYLARA